MRGAAAAAAAALALAATAVPGEGVAAAETPRHPDELRLEPLRFELPPIETDTLACGIPVWGAPDRDLPLVTITARFRVGRRFVPGEELTAMRLFGDLWATGGTRDLDPDAFDARVTELDAQLWASVGTLSGEVTASCVAEDLAGARRLWADVIRSPRFDPDRLDRARAKRLQGLQSINDRPDRILASRFRWLARGRDDPGSAVESRAELDAVGPADLAEIHARFIRPDGMVIGIAGDYDRREMLAALDGLFADWTAGDSPLPEPAPWPAAPSPGVYLLRGDFAQTHVAVGYPVAGLGRASPDYPASRILEFGLGYGRVFYRSREEGLSYGAAVYLRDEDDAALLQAGGSCRPEVATDLAAMLLEELQGVRENPLDAEEVGSARTFRIGLAISESEVPRDLIRSRLGDLVEGRPADLAGRILRGYQDCGPEKVAEVAGRILAPPGDLVVLVVGNPDRLDRPLESLGLGTVTELQPVTFGD